MRIAQPENESMKKTYLSCAALLLLSAAPVFASEGIETDHPDFVQSATTLSPGIFQIETSVKQEREEGEDVLMTPTLLRLGVAEHLEFRMETNGWAKLSANGHGSDEALAESIEGEDEEGGDESGMTDLSLGLKLNLSEAEEGRPATAVLLDVLLPSGDDAFKGHGARPSLRVVAEWELGEHWSTGIMPGIKRENEGEGAYTAGIFGAMLMHHWNENVRTSIEIALPQIASDDHGGTEALAELGTAWRVSENLQLDAAVGAGLNDDSPDHEISLGLSMRFGG